MLAHIMTTMQSDMPRSVAEIQSFIRLLRVACEDKTINSELERLLSFPDEKRQAMVHNWITDLVIGDAPKDFIAAIACLSDDSIAEKAYEVIFNCKQRGA